MAVRSLQLGAVKATNVLTAVYTCPAGRTAIIKEVTAGKGSTGSATLTMTILRGAVAYYLLTNTFSNLGGQAARFETWTVLEPGDIVRAVTDGPTIDVWMSGAELIGVA